MDLESITYMRNPGDYNDRLDWYQQTLEDNVAGEQLETFTFKQKIWCSIVKPKPSERYYAGSMNTVLDCVVLVRGELDITELDQFRDGDWYYRITGVTPDFNQTICNCIRTKLGK